MNKTYVYNKVNLSNHSFIMALQDKYYLKQS